MIKNTFGKVWKPINLVDQDLAMGNQPTHLYKNNIIIHNDTLFYLVAGTTLPSCYYDIPYNGTITQQTEYTKVTASSKGWPSIGNEFFQGNNDRIFLLSLFGPSNPIVGAYTDDYCNTWTAQDSIIRIREALKLDNGRILASSRQTIQGGIRCLWYSDNNGVTFSTLSTNKSNWSPDLMFKTHTGRLLAAGALSSASASLAYSDDNGETWTDIADRPVTDIIEHNNVLYLAYNTELYKSTDDGLTWTLINTFSHNIISLIGYNNMLFVSTVYKLGLYYANVNSLIFNLAEIKDDSVINNISGTYPTFFTIYDNGIMCTMYKGKYVLVTQFDDKEVTTTYLDEKGAQELVTQAKLYVDSLV